MAFLDRQPRRTTQMNYLPNDDMVLSTEALRKASTGNRYYQCIGSETRPFSSHHISMHSRVTSLTGEDTFQQEKDEYEPEYLPQTLPTAYGYGTERRNSFVVLDKNWRESYPASMRDYAESIESETRLEKSCPIIHPEPIRISRPREALFIGVVIMSQFLIFAGLGQAIASMHIISTDLDVTSPREQAWFTAAYALAAGTFILFSARLGDLFGHKKVFIFGYFFLGSCAAFAGFSAYVGSQVLFDVCRAFQGFGAALLTPNALALLGRAYPPGVKKNIVHSLFGVMAPWGLVIGAVFSSLFAEAAWWPWTFWSYGIVAWILSLLSILAIPEQLNSEAQFASHDEATEPGFDLTGALLGITSMMLVGVAWNNGPVFGWNKPHVYFTLILGLVCLGGFVWVEYRASSPLLPIKDMNSTTIYTTLLVGIGWGSFGIWLFYSFRFLDAIRENTPLAVSAQFTPMLITGLLAVIVTGLLLTHTPGAFTMLMSMVAFFLGHLITATQPVQQAYWAQMFVAFIIMPFGIDMCLSAATVILSDHLPSTQPGLAGSLVYTMVFYSISIALGIAGTVETSVNNQAATQDDEMYGIRCAWFTGLALAGLGVILGALFFGRTFVREGWGTTEEED